MAGSRVTPDGRSEHDERVDAARFITNSDELMDLIELLKSEPLYGIDTEFHRERTYFAHVALLQGSWSSGIALIDALAVDITPFGKILEGPGLAILHAADQDLEILDRECGCVPQQMF